jgi:peptidyl-prolyl cis-trans isomerase D
MLDTLRANSRSVLTYVLFGIIIVVFVVSFGPGSRGCADAGVRAASYAARVDGATVTAADYDQAYAQAFRTNQERFAGAGLTFTREMADQGGLRAQVMNGLVERELVLREAARHGVVVSDDELDRAVKSMTGFRTDGRFDVELYRRAVTNAYGSPAKFEERVRKDLAYLKMLALLRETVKISDDEIREAWLAESDRVSLELVRFPVAAAKAEVSVSDAGVRAFAAANAPRIEKAWQDNPSRYRKEKRVHARHILVKVPENAPAAADDAARKKVEDLIARLGKGEDFATLAKASSDDPGSKDRGGDLGFFGKGLMAKPFEDAAFALAPGHISGPVRTRFGWHVLKVEEVQEAETIPLEKARDDIARELVQQEAAAKVAGKRAAEALSRLQTGRKLSDLFPTPDPKKKIEPAKMGGQALSVEQTGPFPRSGDRVPAVGQAPALVADAFASEGPRVLPKVYETPAGPLVAVVKERQKPDPALFAARKEELAQRLRGQRESQVERSWLASLRAKSKVDVNEAFLRGEVAAVPLDLE